MDNESLVSVRGISWNLLPLLCGAVVGFLTFIFGNETTGGGINYTQSLLASTQSNLNYTAVGIRFINIIFSTLSGASGGLLAPSLAVGAGVAGILAKLISAASPVPLMLAGMAAFLAAMLNSPFTATVLVMEMSNQHDIILLLLTACVVSTKIANRFFKSST